jgi:hypothetical protein
VEPYWYVPDVAQSQPVNLESSAGEVWKYVAYVLAGVVAILAGLLWKDAQDDKKEAKEREAQLNVLLNNALKRQKGEDS